MKKTELPDYVIADIPKQVRAALEEDVGSGDITAQLIAASACATATVISREEMVLCGSAWVDEVFAQLGGAVSVTWHAADGDRVSANGKLCSLSGNARQILTGERTALNFLQTLSGTATVAREFADAVADKPITLLDTRKTLPGLRTAQKYAVLCGGCENHRIALYVNTGLMADVARGKTRGAEGVGLYRSEIPFMLRERFPSEEEQRAIYRQQLEAFAPAPVTMRTLDIGGDKDLPYFPIKEDNPFLGWRGIRITLDHPEIFMVQIRAMLKAAIGLDNLQVLLPMISSVFEVEEALHLIHRAVMEVEEEMGVPIVMPKVGVMVEVPATVFQIADMAQLVDFVSVGSNDLTQYMLAVDRNNTRVADIYTPYHPSVLRALQIVVDEVHRVGKPAGICGEMAGDPATAVLLMAMGFDSLSMSASNLLRVRKVLRTTPLVQAKSLLDQVMQVDNAAVIKSMVEFELEDLGLMDLVRPKNKA